MLDGTLDRTALDVPAVRRSTAFLTRREENELHMRSARQSSQQVTLTTAVLSPDNPVLREAVAGRSCLIVCSPSVEQLYGGDLQGYLAAAMADVRVEVMVLRRTEASKTLSAVAEVCDRAAAFGLGRADLVVAIGGGVLTDICGLAAAIYRRGVPHLKIPTTLLGLVDAGIGTKNAVNQGDRKSVLGTFHAPEYSLLDPMFLRTLPRRQLVNGAAEVVKLATAVDAELFAQLEAHGAELVDSRFSTPAGLGREVVRAAVNGMLTELSDNVFEVDGYRRKMDFGHTFSPYFEVSSGHRILHGEAVALDVALSSAIAHSLGLLDDVSLERILQLLGRLGLPLTWEPASMSQLWASLPAICQHRAGELNLVVPVGVGSSTYIGLEAIDEKRLQRATSHLRQCGFAAVEQSA